MTSENKLTYALINKTAAYKKKKKRKKKNLSTTEQLLNTFAHETASAFDLQATAGLGMI